MNGNENLLAAFANIQKYQSNALTGIYNFRYSIVAKLKINFWKFFVKIWGTVKNAIFLFFIFWFGSFSNGFCEKNLWKSHPFLSLISKVCINYYSVTKIWGQEIFDNKTTAFWIIFKTYTETRFHCLFPFNQKIIGMCN